MDAEPERSADQPEVAPTRNSIDRDEALSALVGAVISRDLVAPALFLLDVAQPFRWLVQQALFVAQPLLQPWLGERVLLWASLLEDTDAIERTRQQLARATAEGTRCRS